MKYVTIVSILLVSCFLFAYKARDVKRQDFNEYILSLENEYDGPWDYIVFLNDECEICHRQTELFCENKFSTKKFLFISWTSMSSFDFSKFKFNYVHLNDTMLEHHEKFDVELFPTIFIRNENQNYIKHVGLLEL